MSIADWASLQVWNYNGTANQQFNFSPQPDGVYKIEAENSGKAIEVGANPGQIRQFKWNGSAGQKWRVEPAGRGFFKLISVPSGLALATNPDDPLKLMVAKPGDALEQQWQIVPLALAVGEWTAADVGRVSGPGSTTRDPATGAFTVRSAGIDIWGGDDAVHFVYQKVAGDFEIVARVKSLEKVDWSKAGVLVRESLASNARNVAVVMGSGHGVSLQWRQETKGLSTSIKDEKIPLPRWVKIVRHGDTLTGFHSGDGSAWIQIAVENLPKLPREVFAGIGAISHVDGTTTTSVLESVKLTAAP